MTRGLLVLAPGVFTTVQDAGRPGWAHLGVPRSGWLDSAAARAGNRLVGNPQEAAVLECLLGGLRLELGAAMTVAVTGAPCPVRVQGRSRSRERPVPWGEAVSVPAGAVLSVGTVVEGLRAYVAVAGGLAVDPVLGSRSTDTLSGLGPAPLAAGDVLPVGTAGGRPGPGLFTRRGDVGPVPSGPVELGWTPGPRADWFLPLAPDILAGPAYVVHPDSDRIALRLTGAPLERRPDRRTELPSEGLVLGAVQVPADGQPLIFLADHPTTGGYPVIGVVDPADLDGCAQLRPGAQVSFRPPRAARPR